MMDGLKIIRTIQSTDRFEAYEAEYKGQRVFAKQAKSDKARELLARVPENSGLADHMGQKTDFKFRTPEIYKCDGDWLITEWIEGGSFGHQVEQKLDYVASVLAGFLIVFDHEPVTNKEVRKTFRSDSLADYMREKLPKNLSRQQNQIIWGAKAKFDELQSSLKPAWQDGDIKPEHIFTDPKRPAQFVLIDPEHFDQRWPRFYSLANNYVKYWVRRPKEFSIELLNLFMEKRGLAEEEIFRPLLANIIVRGISLHWEADYDPGAKDYNIPRAQELLNISLNVKSIDELIKG